MNNKTVSKIKSRALLALGPVIVSAYQLFTSPENRYMAQVSVIILFTSLFAFLIIASIADALSEILKDNKN